jgi:hypothetical protein
LIIPRDQKESLHQKIEVQAKDALIAARRIHRGKKIMTPA